MTGIKSEWSFKGRGIEDLTLRMPARVAKSTKKRLEREGKAIMGKSQQLVPRLTGSLASTGKVVTQMKAGKVVVIMSYGDSSVGYAVIVHEQLQEQRRTGTAKYLEIPFRERTAGMARRLAEDIRREMRF